MTTCTITCPLCARRISTRPGDEIKDLLAHLVRGDGFSAARDDGVGVIGCNYCQWTIPKSLSAMKYSTREQKLLVTTPRKRYCFLWNGVQTGFLSAWNLSKSKHGVILFEHWMQMGYTERRQHQAAHLMGGGCHD